MSKTTKEKKPRRNGKSPPSLPAAQAPGELSPAGSKIVSAFEEAIEALRSTGSPSSRLTMRTYHADFVRPAYGPADVRRVRDLLGMSQVVFARFLGVGPNTIRSWEQGSRPPSPIARRFMGEIEGDPDYWRNRVARGRDA
jgi:DNA-binding transcriptional regulator YiaG